MTLTLQPVRVATGAEEEGMLVFDRDQRLLAVLVHLSPENPVAPGHWFLEAGFDRLDGLNHPTFADLDAAQRWILGHGGPTKEG
ncbi:hypothetical protein [Microvirga yunnanensis]|uniref:hypothetical protein n=1 Tax=Microvirga yunnanensis TaxID=2953740 RepID=UPI0021C70DD0|nr:hypothetical protein [Microvirga sp. HBU65207]